MKRKRNEDMSFATRLQELRKNALHKKFNEWEDDKIGYTQEEFAEILGFSYQSVKDWEGGYSFPRADSLKKIAVFFGCDTDYLLGLRDKTCSSLGTSNETLERLYHLPDSHRIKVLLGFLLADLELLDNLAAMITRNYIPFTFVGVQPFRGSDEKLDLSYRDMAKIDMMNTIFLLIRFINECREKNNLDKLDRLLRSFW